MFGCGGSVAFQLTVVAEFPRIGRILSKREFLQIGVGFREQTENKHPGARWVEMCHRFRRVRLRVSRRVDDYDGQRDDKHPHRLLSEAKKDNRTFIDSRYCCLSPETSKTRQIGWRSSCYLRTACLDLFSRFGTADMQTAERPKHRRTPSPWVVSSRSAAKGKMHIASGKARKKSEVDVKNC